MRGSGAHERRPPLFFLHPHPTPSPFSLLPSSRSRWYERSKHLFPASRWEVYDPAVKRERYTVHGDEVNAGPGRR